MATTQKGRRADSAASLGEMEYVDALGLWVYVGGTKGPGKTPTIQPDGTVQWQSPSGGVTSFNGRTGAVVPAAGDYAVADITGLSTALAGKQAAFGSQSANAVYAGPTSGGAAAPSFRALVAADIPSLDAAKITTGVLAIARLATGTPDGTKFVRDDGTLATPTASVGWRFTTVTALINNGNTRNLVTATLGGSGATFLVSVVASRLAFQAAAEFEVAVEVNAGSSSYGIVRPTRYSASGAVIGLEVNVNGGVVTFRGRNNDTLNFDAYKLTVTCLSESPTWADVSSASQAAIATTALYGYERVRLSALEQAGATDKQSMCWDDTNKKWAPLSLGYADITGAAPLASPALTGVPTVPTAAAGTNTTQAASTAFVQAAVTSFGGTIQGSAYRCHLKNSGTISASTLNAYTAIPWDTEIADTDTMHSTVSNTSRITIVTAGTYQLSAWWSSTGAMTGANVGLVAIRLNGSTILTSSAIVPGGNGVAVTCATEIDLSVGDYIEACYYITQAQTIAIGSTFKATKLA
jgi:hypothetical protein